jgi:glycosyltransferase involved in cell wall biosynthesis
MLYGTALRNAVTSLTRQLPNAIYERYALFGTAGLSLARELDIPLVLEVNAPLADEQAAHRGLAFCDAARATERAVLGGADRVVAVSATLRDWLVDAGVAPERIEVLPNGVDTVRFAPAAGARERTRQELGFAAEECVIGFVGTLKAWHGTATLLAAVALLRSVAPRIPIRLLIVGEGPERALLEALAATSGIADITHFTGAVPHAAVPAHVAAMDVAVAPYDRIEGFYFSPLKVFEYMAAGRPVVAAGVGQLAECLRHGERALLYPPGDVAALASALRALAESPRERVRLGSAARQWVATHRTWDGNARRVVELIHDARVGAPSLRDVRGAA